MRRNKEWWLRLEPHERSLLTQLEKASHHSTRSDYIPDDMVECGYCGNPTMGYGLCGDCGADLNRLINKANKQPHDLASPI